MSTSHQNVRANENSTIYLDCHKSSDNIQVNWEFCPIDSSYDSLRCESLFDPHKLYLYNVVRTNTKEDSLQDIIAIQNIKLQNSGVYRCIGEKVNFTPKTIDIKVAVLQALEIHGIIVNKNYKVERTNNIILYDDGRTKSFSLKCISESKPSPNKIYWYNTINDTIYINISSYRDIQNPMQLTCIAERTFGITSDRTPRLFTFQVYPKLRAFFDIPPSRTCIHENEEPQIKCYDPYDERINFGKYSCNKSVPIENGLRKCPKPKWSLWSGCPGIARVGERITTKRNNLNCNESKICIEKYDYEEEICEKSQCIYKMDFSDKKKCSTNNSDLFEIKYDGSRSSRHCKEVLRCLKTMGECNEKCPIGFTWNYDSKTCEGKKIQFIYQVYTVMLLVEYIYQILTFTDIDECKIMENNSKQLRNFLKNSFDCVNTEGSFQIICKKLKYSDNQGFCNKCMKDIRLKFCPKHQFFDEPDCTCKDSNQNE